MRATVSHWNTKALGGSDGDVGSHLSWRSEHGEGQEVRRHDDLGVPGVRLADDGRVVVQGSAGGWVLEKDAADVVPAEVKVVLVGHDGLESEALRPGGADRDGLGVALVGDKELWLLAVRHGAGHGHGLRGSGGLVQQGSVREGEPGEVGDHGLVVEQGLEPTLGDLRLVGRVLRVPAGVLEEVPENDGGRQGSVVPHPDEVLVDLVLASEVLHVLEKLVLGHGLGERAEVEGLALTNVRGHGRVDELGDVLETAVLGHLALDVGGSVADVPRNETKEGRGRI